jgi:hypothetical protein
MLRITLTGSAVGLAPSAPATTMATTSEIKTILLMMVCFWSEIQAKGKVRLYGSFAMSVKGVVRVMELCVCSVQRI